MIEGTNLISINEYPNISVRDLIPGTKYEYYSYLEYDGKLFVGKTKEFTTEPMAVVGAWNCQRVSSSGRVSSFVVTINEEGNAVTTDSIAPGGEVYPWSYNGDALIISFIKYYSQSYTGVTYSVIIEDPDNPIYGKGNTHSWTENYSTGGATHNYYELEMNRQ